MVNPFLKPVPHNGVLISTLLLFGAPDSRSFFARHSQKLTTRRLILGLQSHFMRRLLHQTTLVVISEATALHFSSESTR
jgi:hypothetical protein